MRARRVVVLVVLATACSDSPNKSAGDGGGTDAAPDPGAKSGTRLKLRHYDFGTVRELVGIHDSLRDETCTPEELTDGMTYCRPVDTRTLVYADNTCTQPIGLTSEGGPCAPPPSYFAEYEDTMCSSTMARLFQRGDVITGSGHFTKGPSGSCDAGNVRPSDVYYSLTEVPRTELAALTLSEPFMTGRLGVRYHESADGLRFPVPFELYDGDIGTRCAPRYGATETSATCVPRGVAFASGFSDATCTQRHTATAVGCPAPVTAVSYEACQSDPAHYFAVAAKHSPTTIYVPSGNACVGSPANADRDYYALGEELTLATMAREIGTGTERLQPIHLTNPEGLRMRDQGLLDSQLGVTCIPFVQANGSVLCVPGGTAWQTMYTDAGCTNAIELITEFRQSTCAPKPAPLYAMRAEGAATCGTNNAVRRVGAPYVGAVYELYDGTTCSPFTSTQHTLYRLGEAVPASDLAAGTLVTE